MAVTFTSEHAALFPGFTATLQSLCSPGSYSSDGTTGAPGGCLGCSAALGSGCPAGCRNSTGAVCPAGTYGLGGAVGCTPCPAGTFGATAGLGTAACTGPCTSPLQGRVCIAGAMSPGGVVATVDVSTSERWVTCHQGAWHEGWRRVSMLSACVSGQVLVCMCAYNIPKAPGMGGGGGGERLRVCSSASVHGCVCNIPLPGCCCRIGLICHVFCAHSLPRHPTPSVVPTFVPTSNTLGLAPTAPAVEAWPWSPPLSTAALRAPAPAWAPTRAPSPLPATRAPSCPSTSRSSRPRAAPGSCLHSRAPAPQQST